MDDVPPLKQSERVVAHSAVYLVKVNPNDKPKGKMKAPIGPRETCEIAFPISANNASRHNPNLHNETKTPK